MRILTAIESVLRVFSSFDVYRMSIQADFVAVGLSSYDAERELYVTKPWAKEGSFDLFFFNDEFSEIRYFSSPSDMVLQRIDENKFVGAMIAVRTDSMLGIYLDTSETIALVCGQETEVKKFLELSTERQAAFEIHFDAYLHSLEKLGGHSLIYVSQMRRLLNKG